MLVVVPGLHRSALLLLGARKPEDPPARRIYLQSERDWTDRYTRMIRDALVGPAKGILDALACEDDPFNDKGLR